MSFDPAHLAALAAILRTGSFEGAAADLGVTPSAVSQRIRALEDRAGVVLIRRGAPCTGTAAGARLAKHAEDVGLLEGQLRRDLGLDAEAAPARLRIAVNADSLATWFVPALAAVPGMLFDLALDDQDHSADWLRRGAVSAAVTGETPAVTGCDARVLGSLRYLATASPAFVERWFGDGVTPAALAAAPCLTFGPKDELQRRWVARVAGEAAPAPPVHVLPSTHAFIDAAEAGLGWGMNPEVLARGPIRAGRLVTLIRDAPLDVPLVWQVSRVMARALGPLTRAVTGAARTGLVPPSPGSWTS